MQVRVVAIRQEDVAQVIPGTPINTTEPKFYAEISAVESFMNIPGRFSIEIDDAVQYTVGKVYNLTLEEVAQN